MAHVQDYDRTLEDNQDKIKQNKQFNDDQPDELKNLAIDMDEKTLTMIGNMVVTDYQTDEESRSSWIGKHTKWLKLYFQDDQPINRPWEGSSEESIPILAEAVNQTSARFKKAFFPGRTRIIKAIPTANVTEEDMARADRVSLHLSWQCMVRSTSYRPDKRRLLQDVPLHGSCFTKTWYDPVKGQWKVKNVRAVDFVVPYGRGPREVEDLERTTEIIPMSVNLTRKHKKSGYFIDTAEPYTLQKETSENYQQTVDSIHGLNESISVDSATPVVLIEQHRYLDLDKDGIEEPYIVTVDLETSKVLRVSQRWDEDDEDNKEPIQYYTHYFFMENPDGFYGLGYGHLVGSPNTAVNKMLRQGVDAATLATSNTGFISESLGIRGGEISTHIGKYRKVSGSVQDIKNGIITLDHKGPNQAHIQLMELIIARADRLAMVTDALTGQTDKVMQPTTIMALVEQGLQQFSSSLEGLVDSWSSELRKIYRLNKKYLFEPEYFAVLDMQGGPQRMQADQNDYESDLQITPVADPKNAIEQQKLTRAEAEWQFAQNNVLINPALGMNGSAQHYYEASVRYLEALDVKGIEKLVPNPKEMAAQQQEVQMQQQQQLEQEEAAKGPVSQKEENFFALLPEPQVPPVRPEDDHLQHYAEGMEFLNDPQYGTRMTPEGEKQLRDHVQMHVAFMYGIDEAGMGDIMTPEGQAPAVSGPQPGPQSGPQPINGVIPQ